MKNLIVKSVLGLLFLDLCLALALFISAGSLAFWQAWVSVGLGGLDATMVAKRTAETRPGAMANPLLSSAVQPQPEVDEYVGSQNEEQQQTLEHFRDGIG